VRSSCVAVAVAVEVDDHGGNAHVKVNVDVNGDRCALSIAPPLPRSS